MTPRLLRAGLVLVPFVAGVYLFNASWLAAPPNDPKVRLIAHRGVHQTYDRTALENDTCTAEHIYPPEHAFLENTLPSIEAAFAAGAEIVEFDVHATTDGKFAVSMTGQWTAAPKAQARPARTTWAISSRSTSVTAIRRMAGRPFPCAGRAWG